MGYMIYGKVMKRYKTGDKYLEPQFIFRALTFRGERVSRLSNAHIYDPREEAQARIDGVMKKHKYPDCVVFEISKAK